MCVERMKSLLVRNVAGAVPEGGPVFSTLCGWDEFRGRPVTLLTALLLSGSFSSLPLGVETINQRRATSPKRFTGIRTFRLKVQKEGSSTWRFWHETGELLLP